MPEPDAQQAREPTEADFEAAQKLLQVFDQQNDDGEHVFSDEDVRHFVPLLLLSLGGDVDTGALGEETLLLIGETAAAAGIEGDASGEAAAEKITAYYEANPPNEALLEALNRFLREGLAEGQGPGVSSAVKSLLAQEASNRPVGDGPAPPGSVRGGLGARFANLPPKADDADK
jgi:hypothetical protein